MAQHGPRDGNLQHDNEFWRFSLAIYGQADVAQECLALQETLGIDVNLLLFCAWLGTRAIVMSNKDIESASESVLAWHERVVEPMRGARRWIKSLESDELGVFRERVKALELDAERIEQATLFAHAKQIRGQAAADRREAITRNVGQYLQMQSRVQAASAPRLIDAAARMIS